MNEEEKGRIKQVKHWHNQAGAVKSGRLAFVLIRRHCGSLDWKRPSVLSISVRAVLSGLRYWPQVKN